MTRVREMGWIIPRRLEGKVALVTGAGRGIGRAVATRLAQEGATVALADWDAKGLADTLRAISPPRDDSPAAFRVDVSRRSDVDQLIKKIRCRWGRLDVLVNNAAVSGGIPFMELTQANWERVVGVNLIGMFHCVQAAVPLMAAGGGGSIVNLSSITAEVGAGDLAHYASTKGAIRSFTRSLTIALASRGIRANSVSPGTIRTPANSLWLDKPGIQAQALTRIPAGRIGQPEDVAALVAYLAADESAYLNGTDILIDGGQRAVGRKME